MTTQVDRQWSDDAFVNAARRLWYLGCFTMPALVLRVGGVTVSDIAFILSAVLTALSLAKRPDLDVPAKGWFLGGMMVVAAALLTVPTSSAPLASVTVAGRLIFLWWVWRWQAASLLRAPEHFRRSIFAFLIGGAASAAAGAAQIAFGLDILGQEVTDVLQSRASGLTGHVNDQGGTLGIAVALGVGLYLHSRSRFALLLVLACGGGLVISGSVTGMLAALVGTLLILWRNGMRASFANIVKFAVVVAGAGWIATYFQRGVSGADPISRVKIATGLGDPVAGVSGPTSTDIRFQTWRYAWDQIQAHPFTGVGLGGESGYLPGSATATHNLILLFWFQGGLLALLALAIVLGSVVRLIRRAPRDAYSNTFVGATIAALLFSMTAPITYQRYFWLPIVLLIAYSTTSRRADTRPSELGPLEASGDRAADHRRLGDVWPTR